MRASPSPPGRGRSSTACSSIPVAPFGIRALAQVLKAEGFDVFLDVTATDWLPRVPRFDVVWHFYSTRHFCRVRVKTQVAADGCEVESLVGIYGSAAYMERECHEMYGIRFRGNDDLRPLLLYEGFVGHPLRKDYDKLAEQPLIPMRDPRAERIAAGWGELPPLATATEVAPLPFGPMPNPVRPAFTKASRADRVIVNIGPSHPATHGTVQIIAELDGEKVTARRRALRLPAPRLREGVRVAHLAQPDPLRRPAELLLGADQRLRLRRRRREADGHRDHAALPRACARCSRSTRASPTT